MKNKIRFYRRKKNGQISKNPIYIEELNKHFCNFELLEEDYEHYLFDPSSLYEVYLEILNLEDLNGDFFIGKLPITQETILDAIKNKVEIFQTKIVIAIQQYQSAIQELEKSHKNSFQNLQYVATQMQQNIIQYKEIQLKIEKLQQGTIKLFLDDDTSNIFENIIDDIEPITASDLI